MLTSAERRWAVDTSFAVAALDASHEAHVPCRDLARARRPLLAGHAAFETFAVLTRLPGPLRPAPATVGRLLASAFPARCWLTRDEQDQLHRRLPGLGLAGGTVYDALVAEAARVNGCTLLTRDARARRTYDLLGVAYELVT